jgi:NAD(P)-dependent dehydrogenase (short-subunit alcohol dehydrogenase family)
MSQEFNFAPRWGQFAKTFFHSQFFATPPYPEQSFANQVVIVTGSNVGLGLDAARHFYRLNCAKLILAVRTVSKGETAKEDIVQSVKHRTDADVIEVWPLDLTSTESTIAFSKRVLNELPRLDVVVENAGINNRIWNESEGVEQMIQVNVLNTFLLALSILPRLEETKAKFAGSLPHLVIVSSEAHRMTSFKELNSPDIYKELEEREGFDGQDRYVKN